MKAFQRLSGAVMLALMLGAAALADDPPIEPPPNCGHMDTMKCTPTGSTQMQLGNPEDGQMETGVASSITEAARIVLESALQLL